MTSHKKEAKSAAERQVLRRQRMKDAGESQINLITDKETVRRLKIYSDSLGISQSESLSKMIDEFWRKLSKEEVEKIEGHALTTVTMKKIRTDGDTRTQQMF
jgi:hypothetical protein